MPHSPSDSFQDPSYNPSDDYWQTIDWEEAGGFMDPTMNQPLYGHNDSWSLSSYSQTNQESSVDNENTNGVPEDEFIDYEYGGVSDAGDAGNDGDDEKDEREVPTTFQGASDESDNENPQDAEEGWWADEDDCAEDYDNSTSDAWSSKENLSRYATSRVGKKGQTTTTMTTSTTTITVTDHDSHSEQKVDSLDDDDLALAVEETYTVDLDENDFVEMRSVDVYDLDIEDGYRSPDVLPDAQYHPDHPEVRTRINALYDELATSESEQSPSSTPLPYPLSPAVSHFARSQVAQARPPITNVQELMDRLIRDHLPQFWRYRAQDPDLNKFNSKAVQNSRPHKYAMFACCVDCGYKFHKQPLYDCSAAERQRHRGYRKELVHSNVVGKGDRGAWRPRKEIRAVRLFEYRTKMGLKDNSFMTQTNIDHVLNNNRNEYDYDGNLDYIGVKEEGHPQECPRNRPPKKSGTKLHFGWEIAVGHDHSSLPIHPSANHSNPLFNFASLPSKRIPNRYYPARSLMAGFAHILPQGETLPQNKLRKLFAYFVWHPWFDCDLQAMTIRSGYRELWPLFLLRDEDPEVTAVEADLYRQMQSTNANAQRKKRKAPSDVQSWSNESAPSKKPKAKWARKSCKEADAGNEDLDIKAEDDEEDDDDMNYCADERKLPPEEVERERLLSLEQRFTTMFNIGLMCHGVVNESRNQSSAERARVHRQVNRGWVFRARPKRRDSMVQDDSGNDGDNETDPNDSSSKPRVKNVHKIYEYTARRDDGNRKSPYPRTRYSGCFPLMKHKALTRPHLVNALEMLEGYLPHFFIRAEIRRRTRGFVLPEYMIKGKDSKSGQLKGKARKEYLRGRTQTSSPEITPPPIRGLEPSVHGVLADARTSLYPHALQRARQGASVGDFGPAVHPAIASPQHSGRSATPSATFSPGLGMSLYPLLLPTAVPSQSQPSHSPHLVANPVEFDLRLSLPQALYDPNQAPALPSPTLNMGDSSAQTFLQGTTSIASSHQVFDVPHPSTLGTIAPSDMHLSPLFDFSQAGVLSTTASTPALVPSPVQNPLSTFVVPPSHLDSNALFSNALLTPCADINGLHQHQGQGVGMAANMSMNETSTAAPAVPSSNAQQNGSMDVYGVRDSLSDDEIRAILEASMGGWSYNTQDKL
ncbi:hypothetical protein BGX34_007939 [Mortierella sp. NVP85]|nr:hypothetical protein BGX34_007939 [Mortierella sp. NVP85]